MKAMTAMVLVMGLAASGSWVQADVLEVSPTEAVVVPATGDQPTQVGLKFDFAAMRQGDGRRIDMARLEWPVGAPAATDLLEFESFAATVTWTSSSVALGQASLQKGDRRKDGLIAPRDSGTEAVVLTVDVTDLVAAWVSGKVSNDGLVLTTQDVSAARLESALSAAKLKVWYGFHRPASSGQ